MTDLEERAFALLPEVIKRGIEFTGTQLGVLAKVSAAPYTEELMTRILSLITKEEYSEDYLLFLLELAHERPDLHATLIVDIAQFLDDQAAETKTRREMVERVIKKHDEYVKAKRAS